MIEHTYRLGRDADGNQFIRCLWCGLASYHPGEIANRYCVNCHLFHLPLVDEACGCIPPRPSVPDLDQPEK